MEALLIFWSSLRWFFSIILSHSCLNPGLKGAAGILGKSCWEICFEKCKRWKCHIGIFVVVVSLCVHWVKMWDIPAPLTFNLTGCNLTQLVLTLLSKCPQDQCLCFQNSLKEEKIQTHWCKKNHPAVVKKSCLEPGGWSFNTQFVKASFNTSPCCCFLLPSLRSCPQAQPFKSGSLLVFHQGFGLFGLF